MNLGEVQVLVNQNRRHGTTCPACHSVVKVYRRSLNSGMAKALIDIVKAYLGSKDWVDIQSLDVRGGDYGKLRHFGLIVSSPDGAGFWKPTQLGIDFVLLRKAAPKWVEIDRGAIVGVSSDKITVLQALKNKFSYAELMRGFMPNTPQINLGV